MIDEATYYERPIALRNPIVFYEGHLPAFNVIVLIKRGLGRPGADEQLETLFARGIDPEDERTAQARGNPEGWPSRDAVPAYARAADALMRRCARARADRCIPGIRCSIAPRRRAHVLEHEAMHQETLLYMWHRLALDAQAHARPMRHRSILGGAPPPPRTVARARRTRDARRARGGEHAVRLGQRVRRSRASTCPRSTSTSTT